MIINGRGYNGGRDQIRDQEALIRQLKNDYAECQNLWVRIQNKSTDNTETEKILQIIAWIKTEIKELQGISGSTIEGVSWGEMDKIQREINSIQNEIRIKIIESVSDETDK